MSTELFLFVLLVVLVLSNVSLEFIARWRNPPIGQFLDINGVRLHYVVSGNPDALTLVMLHGNGTLLQDFSISGLAAAASNSFRVICFDRPGFGHSSRPRAVIWSPERQAELLCAALARLGIERALVLGHSWGALVALAMARHNSERVRGLVLISGYYFPTWRFDVWFASAAAIPLVGDALRYTISPISTWLALPVFAKKSFAPRPVPDIVKTQYPRLMLIRPSQLRAVAEDFGIHGAIRGKDDDVLSSPRVSHRDHRRAKGRDCRQRTSGEVAGGDATCRRDRCSRTWTHAALLCDGWNCQNCRRRTIGG